MATTTSKSPSPSTGVPAGAEAVRTTPVTYVAFDLLFDGEDLTGRPIETRLERMAAIDLPAPLVRSQVTENDGEALFAAVAEQGLEGIVAKKRGSPYRPGVRSRDWRKVPHLRIAPSFTSKTMIPTSSYSETCSRPLGWHTLELDRVGVKRLR